jgi:hypothetical protein
MGTIQWHFLLSVYKRLKHTIKPSHWERSPCSIRQLISYGMPLSKQEGVKQTNSASTTHDHCPSCGLPRNWSENYFKKTKVGANVNRLEVVQVNLSGPPSVDRGPRALGCVVIFRGSQRVHHG